MHQGGPKENPYQLSIHNFKSLLDKIDMCVIFRGSRIALLTLQMKVKWDGREMWRLCGFPLEIYL